MAELLLFDFTPSIASLLAVLTGPIRNSTVASTTTQSRNTLMLMRSHNPIHGVGRLAWTRGASQKVNTPNARSTTMLAIE